MGAIALELRCPQSVGDVAADPQLDWSFDNLLSELNAIEKKLNVSPVFTKTVSREFAAAKDIEKGSKRFVMHVSDDDDDEMEDMESDGDRKESHGAGTRFAFDELYASDSEDSEDESTQLALMDRAGLVEGALIELNHEHQLSVTEEIRNQIYAFEADLMYENEKFVSALSQVEKYTEAQREMDRKLDMQYQRRIAEALDNHLTAIQRDHENKSQIEERKIRDDAAIEEAKRKEKAMREEKIRQEKMKAEAEARLQAEKKRDEAAKAAALETERAAKQAADTVANETQKQVAAAMAASLGTTGQKKEEAPGNTLKGAEKALKMEERRLQIYKELASKNEGFGLSSTTEYRSHGNQIARRIKTINGTKENVRSKAEELIKIFNSSCPQSISIAMFAEKLVSHCVNPTGSFNNAMYAYCQVVVMVTSQVPLAMEILLAELNRVCIYTVPKYIIFSQSEFGSREAYQKALGYREEDGKIESTESYAERISSYMKLYGALVQTEVDGFQNLHGIKEGWTWLACFLNTLPANYYTAVALQGFLEMAGFALNRRYKEQFGKLLNVISGKFLNALKGREDPRLKKVVMSIQNYLETKQFLEEPEGRRLQQVSLLSHEFVPGSETEQQEQYYPSDRQQYNNQYHSSDRQQYNNQYHSSDRQQYNNQYHSSDRQQYNQYSNSRFRYQR